MTHSVLWIHRVLANHQAPATCFHSWLSHSRGQCLDYLDHKKVSITCIMSIKLDLHNAFNLVECNFLIVVLKKMDISSLYLDSFINSIYFFTSSVDIMSKDEFVCSINSHKCTRQGCRGRTSRGAHAPSF